MNAPKHNRPSCALGFLKSILWILFFAGMGALFCVFMIVLYEGWPNYWLRREYMFPFAGLLLSGVSAGALIACYRAEPVKFSGFWHISLGDLLTASIFTAAMMSTFRAVFTEAFVPNGIVTAVLMGLLLTFCLLLAARRGCAAKGIRWLCALGYFLSALGWMAAGMFLFILVYDSIWMREIAETRRWVMELLFLVPVQRAGDMPIYNIVRIGFLCAAIGAVFQAWVNKSMQEKHSP